MTVSKDFKETIYNYITDMFLSEIEDIKDNLVYCGDKEEKEKTEYHLKVLEEYLTLVEFDKKNLDGK